MNGMPLAVPNEGEKTEGKTVLDASLPNIVGEFGSVTYCSAYNKSNPSMFGSGAFTLVNRATLYNEYGHVRKAEGENKPAYGYTFNASSYNQIYNRLDNKVFPSRNAVLSRIIKY